ncbi:29623_t:CDS:2 [Gigaspora margarita]|uniref:29623_t:CDS:1 n=1 Tax=Gigaspora margarita TaxID=4874 RepID=A0ABN7UZ20_GIGMA|nr:29623_t:CDS:2 [Gigaspora margarita]
MKLPFYSHSSSSKIIRLSSFGPMDNFIVRALSLEGTKDHHTLGGKILNDVAYESDNAMQAILKED